MTPIKIVRIKIQYSIILLILIAIFSCQPKKEKVYNLNQLDAYSFRRNYFGHDALTGKALDTFMNRNPVQNYEYKTKKGKFYDELTTHGIIENQELILQKFDSLPDQFSYNFQGRKITVDISYPDSFETYGHILTFREKENIILKDTLLFDSPPDVTYSKMDLNNNGTEEIYTIFKNYRVNGHNFEVSIYELKENSL